MTKIVHKSKSTTRAALLAAFATCLLGSSWPEVAVAGGGGGARKALARAAGHWRADHGVAMARGLESWRGSTRAELVMRQHHWLYSIPWGVNPLNEVNGANCGINQKGDVWFLAGPGGFDWTTTCVVPAGKAIVSSVYAVIDDYPCPAEFEFEPAPGQSLEEFLLEDATQYIDPVTVAEARLDGRPLAVPRVKTKLFSFTAAASMTEADPCVTGSPQLGVLDGYWVFIGPLPRGDHVLELRWAAPGQANMGTINLQVR